MIMKRIHTLLAGAALISAAGLASCSGSQNLGERLSGTWQSNPTPIATTEAGITTMTDFWTFTPEAKGADQGTVNISSTASVEWPLDAAATDTIAPASDTYALSLSATVTISGTWDISSHDPDDELIVSFDPKSLTVNIDPVADAMSGDGNATTVNTIPAEIYSAAQNELLKVARERFFPINRIEDIEFKDGKIKFEVPSAAPGRDEVEIVLRSVTPTAD